MIIRNTLVVVMALFGILLILINVVDVKDYGTRYQWQIALHFIILIDLTFRLFEKHKNSHVNK